MEVEEGLHGPQGDRAGGGRGGQTPVHATSTADADIVTHFDWRRECPDLAFFLLSLLFFLLFTFYSLLSSFSTNPPSTSSPFSFRFTSLHLTSHLFCLLPSPLFSRSFPSFFLSVPEVKFTYYNPKKLDMKPSFPFRATTFVLDPTKVTVNFSCNLVLSK